MQKKEISMLTAYLITPSGAILGGLQTLIIYKEQKEPVSQPVSPIIVEPVDPVGDVAKQLTNLDLLVEPAPLNIKENGDLLAGMYCRVMGRG
ncbi:MAG: hypothetical protein CM15mV149_110 [uncultured marine virus]|nr:MAG: hypothetical protein CM15mV149_110 [uncultured marine virus]